MKDHLRQTNDEDHNEEDTKECYHRLEKLINAQEWRHCRLNKRENLKYSRLVPNYRQQILIFLRNKT